MVGVPGGRARRALRRSEGERSRLPARSRDSPRCESQSAPARPAPHRAGAFERACLPSVRGRTQGGQTPKQGTKRRSGAWGLRAPRWPTRRGIQGPAGFPSSHRHSDNLCHRCSIAFKNASRFSRASACWGRVTAAQMSYRCEKIGERLSWARQRAGLSANALAKAAGLTHTTIQDIEQGRRAPVVLSVEKLAAALKVSACWLAFGAGQPDDHQAE